MPGFEELHVTAAAAAALHALGWTTEDAAAREAAPTAARGHNLVVVAPPAPAYAAPALAGLLGRLGGDGGVQGLLLAPAAELDEWGAIANALGRDLPARVQVAHGESRALRRLRARELDLLITTPEIALALVRRSALKMEAMGVVCLAWPESLGADEALTPLMHDLPKEAQRIIFTAAADRLADLVERYARKAMTVGAAPAESTPLPPAGPVRTVAVPWQRRAAALSEVVELLDPASLVVWAADLSHEAAIAAAVPLGDAAVTLTTDDAPKASLIIAFDPPSPERLRQLLGAGDVVLLVPPTADAYVTRIATPRRPIRLSGLLEAVTHEAGAHRAAIARAIEENRPERALLTLAPLFERYDPSAVAAALYDLWVAKSGAGVPGAVPDVPATSKMLVGVGMMYKSKAKDLVAILTKELRLDKAKIGRIELKDSFLLVDVPAQDAERIAAGLNGAMIRRKRVTARVDRGAARPAGRGAPARGGPRGAPRARD